MLTVGRPLVDQWFGGNNNNIIHFVRVGRQLNVLGRGFVGTHEDVLNRHGFVTDVLNGDDHLANGHVENNVTAVGVCCSTTYGTASVHNHVRLDHRFSCFEIRDLAGHFTGLRKCERRKEQQWKQNEQ